MPGGFHPFHAGHASLYQSAVKAFPGAEVYVAATNDTKTRPFPFAIKEKLAKLAGVAPGHFIQVKSPFQPREITDKFNPEQDVVIFVRSEKDKNESPKPGGTKKDGTPAYFQPWTGKDVQPFGKHAYMAYLPTVEFGPGITSATEIRNAWPKLNDKRKTAMVMSLYPATQKNPKLAANVVKMLDMGMGEQQGVAEGSNGSDIKLSHSMSPDMLYVHATSDGTDVGGARFKKIDGVWTGDIVHVYPQFRRQGVATKIYDYAEELVGKIIPSKTLKPKGKKFWSSRDTQGVAEDETLDEGPFVQRIVRPNKVNIYVRHNAKKPALLVATDIPYAIYDKFIAKAMEKYPQFNQTDFSFKSADRTMTETNLSESADYLEEK
jgi:GNAT superfamily N-acetyltransferase